MESIFEKIDEENIKNQNLWRAGLLFITCALSIAILTSVVTDFVVPFEYRIGEIARHSVLAPRDFIFEDVIGTEQRKAEAESSIPRVFVLDDRPQSRPSTRLNRMLEEIRVSTLPGNAEQDAKLRARIAEHYNLPLSDTGWELLRDPTSWPLLRETVERVVDPVLEKGVFSGKRALATTLSKYGVTMTRRSTGVSKPLVSPESVYDLNDATEILEASLPAMDMGVPTGLDKLVADVCRALLKPNLTFDSQETGRRIRDARSDTEPMFFQVRKGEVIVGEGERISRAHARKLDQLEKLRAGLGGLHSFAGYLILALLLTSTVYIFFFKFVDEFKPNFRDLTMIAVTLVASFIALRLMTTVGTAVSASFPAVGANAVTLATPFAIGGIVLQLTLGPGAVLFFTMICALLTGVFLQ
ncbi:MAG: hypothetical protein IT290_10155, partial [Deltaproteobacteria bacterium]|nr:hypothetical protein [Deltaproteobacteria bacterium]